MADRRLCADAPLEPMNELDRAGEGSEMVQRGWAGGAHCTSNGMI